MDVRDESLHDRRVRAAAAGHSGTWAHIEEALADPNGSIRALGYGAAARSGHLDEALAVRGLNDSDTRVVRRVIEAVARLSRTQPGPDPIDAVLLALLAGADDAIAEVAAWALGERHQQHDSESESGMATFVEPDTTVIQALATQVTHHADALVRESAVAALGAIGDPLGLPAILAATRDKATVRRRAVLALAPFDGPEVMDALRTARTDRDWQVRQAAEDLLRD